MGRSHKRRGSSTRKHRIPLLPSPKQKPTKQPPLTEQDMIGKLEALLKHGKNKKGEDLTHKEISTFLTTIATLEHKLGIKHE